MPSIRRPLGGAARRALLVLAAATLACGGSGGDGRWATFHPGRVPADLARGERLYNSYCLSCHGLHGKGDGLGPPMLDSLFLAASVPDERYRLAVRQGVNQRHYDFGAMPPLGRVSDEEAVAITAYVRWLQARAWDGGKGS